MTKGVCCVSNLNFHMREIFFFHVSFCRPHYSCSSIFSKFEMSTTALTVFILLPNRDTIDVINSGHIPKWRAFMSFVKTFFRESENFHIDFTCRSIHSIIFMWFRFSRLNWWCWYCPEKWKSLTLKWNVFAIDPAAWLECRTNWQVSNRATSICRLIRTAQ